METKVLKIKIGTCFVDGKSVDVFNEAWEKTSKDGKTTYKTHQIVNLDLHDINKFYDFQLTLLTNGFDQFSSKFAVENESNLIEKGYEKAIKNAKAEAELLANKINKKLGTAIAILSRAHSDDVIAFSAMESRAKIGSLLDIKKMVSKRINMKIMFEISN